MSTKSAGRAVLLAISLGVVTVGLIAIGTIWPGKSVLATAGVSQRRLIYPSTPQASVENLIGEIGRHEWQDAYSNLANKSEFTEPEFVQDLTGSHGGLRTYATLAGYDISTQHASADKAQVRATLRWSTVVDTFQDVRDLNVVRTDDKWRVAWPIARQPRVAPQVIPVNYLRWDVIFRGAGDDWGAQDVESPHVRIVDMHPADRASQGTVILGELLNEDVVPAYVTVKATLLAKNGSSLDSENAFDKMSHILLPKQITPFRIDFPNVRLSQVDSVRMEPSSSLVSASADPVVEIENQKLHPVPDFSLTGDLVNQSGQAVGIAHVLATFYGSNGDLLWVSDGYADRALLPQIPVPFTVSVPPDLGSKIVNYRVIASTYSENRLQ